MTLYIKDTAMSLDFNYGKVKNYKTVCFDRPCTDCQGPDKPCPEHADVPLEERTMMSLATESLIWYLGLSIGIPKITEKNWEEVALRVALYEKVIGSCIYKFVEGKGRVKIPITKEDVQRHIGLDTNGITLTKAQFLKKLAERVRVPTDEDVERLVEPVVEKPKKKTKTKKVTNAQAEATD
jgi:hypothetical protein